jgi:hypothetical protein
LSRLENLCARWHLTIQQKREAGCSRSAGPSAQEHLMLDIVMLALALGLFAAGIGYAYACERL